MFHQIKRKLRYSDQSCISHTRSCTRYPNRAEKLIHPGLDFGGTHAKRRAEPEDEDAADGSSEFSSLPVGAGTLMYVLRLGHLDLVPGNLDPGFRLVGGYGH